MLSPAKRMKSTLLVMAIAVPLIHQSKAFAGTWVTYRSNFSSEHGQIDYQVDALSIATHAGWTHANHRICTQDESECRRITVESVKCSSGKYKSNSSPVYTLKNQNEWWLTDSTKAGGKVWDQFVGSLYNFLCNGQ